MKVQHSHLKTHGVLVVLSPTILLFLWSFRACHGRFRSGLETSKVAILISRDSNKPDGSVGARSRFLIRTNPVVTTFSGFREIAGSTGMITISPETQDTIV